MPQKWAKNRGGKESRDYLGGFTPERVTVVAHDRDRYGRTVGEAFTAGETRENPNLAMVWSGKAAVCPKYFNDRQYYQAEQEVRKVLSGI